MNIYKRLNNWTTNGDFVDVNNEVDLSEFKLKEIPLKFGTIHGNFLINDNYLTSLENCPKIVLGTFACNGNYLTSLENCPTFILNHFGCFWNKIFPQNFHYILGNVCGKIYGAGNNRIII